jgi:hypothetical protein
MYNRAVTAVVAIQALSRSGASPTQWSMVVQRFLDHLFELLRCEGGARSIAPDEQVRT